MTFYEKFADAVEHAALHVQEWPEAAYVAKAAGGGFDVVTGAAPAAYVLAVVSDLPVVEEEEAPAEHVARNHAKEFVAGLNAKFPEHEFSVAPGRKYDKIVKEGSQRTVHAFVERATGFVFKAAGWNAPASGVRYTSVDAALEAADAYGGYLYKR